MRQRVMIAMALSCKPKLLIADEPTTALDVTIQAQILSLLKELNTTLQTTILFITHDLGVMAEIADEVMVFYAGKVVEHTTIEALFDAPKHPYTQGLLRSRPIHAANGYLPSIKGNVPSLSAMPKGCAFAPRCEKALPICFEKQPLETLDAENKSVACFLYEEGEEK
jgi:oligopeptide/dipeptide ABC transporter ATP-binding protein